MVQDKVTRRNWLKKTGAFAVVPAGAMSSGRNKTEKLPELRNRDGIVRYMEVPKAWAEHKRRVKSVKNKIEDAYLRREGVRQISMERAPETHGEKHGFQVRIGIEKDKIKSETPDHVDDVRVNTVEQAPIVETCYNHSYNDLPPGANVLSGNSGTVSRGTTGFPVQDGWSTYMLTAHHVDHSGDLYGDKDQWGYLTKVGSYHDGDSNLDISLFGSSRSISTTIQGDGNTYPIGGWITEDGIEERVSNYWDGYRKMGCTTGETTGGLTDCHVSNSTYSYYGEGVKGGADVANGDSGGPAFDVIQGEAYLEYLVSASEYSPTNKSNCRDNQEHNNSMGPAAYEIDNHYWIVNS